MICSDLRAHSRNPGGLLQTCEGHRRLIGTPQAWVTQEAVSIATRIPAEPDEPFWGPVFCRPTDPACGWQIKLTRWLLLLLIMLLARAAATAEEPGLVRLAPVPTDEPPAALPDPVPRIDLDELLKRVELLESRESNADAKDKSGAKPKPNYFDQSKESWNVKLGGHVQLDYITWADADPEIVGAENYFSFRRLRLVADGTGYGQFDFRLQMTLEPGEGPSDRYATPDVKDAYLTMNEIPWIGRFRIGNFFVPFSLEQVTNDTNNLFSERSIPTQNIFAADREVGIAVYNHSEDKNVTWSGGMFFDDLSDTFKTRINDNQGYRLSGRVTWLPYYDEASHGRYLVHTGAGILYTHDFDDIVRFRSRPQVQRGPLLIDTGPLNAGSHTTGNLELAVVWGSVTLQNEAFLCRVNMHSGEALHLGGAYTHLSWFLTGENRIFNRFGQHGPQFGRNVPYTNFFLRPGCYGPGAWEAKARCSYLNLEDAAAGQYIDMTLGFNWYWSDRTRVMFDWIHPWTSSQTRFGATSSDLLAMRFDFNW